MPLILKPSAQDLWSGTASATFNGVTSSSAAHTGKSSADQLVVTADIRDLSAAKQKQIREKVEAFAENTNPQDLQHMSLGGTGAV